MFLIDRALGHRYNTRMLSNIAFRSIRDDRRRFDVEITKSTINESYLDFLSSIKVYHRDGQLIVEPQSSNMYDYHIEVFDILGRCLAQLPLTTGRQLILLNTPSQLLNIRLSSAFEQRTVKTWWEAN